MSKLLLFAILGLVVYLLLKRSSRRPAQRRQETPNASAQQMVSCAHCGVYVPESESLASGGRHYCSEPHRKLGATGSAGDAGDAGKH
ncbi:conserved protein of unknown function [Sterolibacterium denitrificans]|uniref:Preprotein translocase subunit YajC n=1 Tax=Sterolibacterium denitrificans TaxID=157592 RepID=A0A7Z7MV51_9PROT|nr:PP0621 family protein [Sterolibacterium denitrificans]SMB24098.1 conserved protein of unknown function [Sterolibacterium denitrificans]